MARSKPFCTRLSGAALVVAAIWAGLGGSSASAATGYEIAYGCKLDICLLDPASPSAAVNLTDNEGVSIDEKPIWSPDGRRVAFISRFASEPIQTRNLYVMEPEAGEQLNNIATQITHFTHGEYVGEAVWSPDGTRIAFVVGVDEGSRKVEVANSDGTTATPVVVAEHGQHPTWAPESGKIAYSYGPQVYVKSADGSGTATPLANAAGKEPTWSPDGTRIAFDLPQPFGVVNLQVATADGVGTPVTLTSGAQWTYSSWSPSGAQVGYLVSGGGSDTHWRVANADGAGDHALTVAQEVAPGSPLSWSPDGTRVVYGGFDFAGGADTNQVYLENSDGTGAVTPLTGDDEYEPYPSWRPIPPYVPGSTAPTVFTPAGGSGASTSPLPVTMPKPKTVWITKRIFVSKGPDYTVIIGSYGCGGPSCGVGTEGKYKGAVPAGLTFSLDRGPARPKGKSRPVVVGKGRTTIPGGQSGPVKMRLTKAGAKLLEKLGSLKIAVTVTVTIPGQKPTVEHRQVTVALKQRPKGRR